VFLVIYFLQANFFSWYNIAGIKPNLFIILIMFIGLFLGRTCGFSLGIVFGFLMLYHPEIFEAIKTQLFWVFLFKLIC